MKYVYHPAKMDADLDLENNPKQVHDGEFAASIVEPQIIQMEHNGTNGIKDEDVEMGKSIEELPVPSTKPSRMSLISTPKEKKEKRETSTLSAELQTLLSSLYMDATARMRLTYPLRCAQDLAFCHSKHYAASMPDLPCHTQSANLRCTWQQGRYVEFIQTASDMCMRCEFPGEGIFAKLVELILTTASPKQAYVSIVRVFRLFVHTFPPCWVALRPRYINFFRKTLQIPKLSSKNDNSISKASRVFDIMFSLIEHTFNDYAELLKKLAEEPDVLSSSQTTSLMETSNIKSQCFSHLNWEDCNGDTDAFFKLKSDARLERINVVLDMLLQILEIDLTMWLLHYHRKPKESMFHREKTPLVIVVFEMTEHVRLTSQVQRLFTILSKGIAMDLSRTHLKIVERYVALVMVASHTADIENSLMGIRYPCLQPNTKDLIKEFYKIFKSHNTTSIKPFLTAIDLLRIPYVRFEFIDNFLQIFDHSKDTQTFPGKVITDLQKFWPKYKMQADVSNTDEEISREQFFKLLLMALRAYCEMYGLQRVMRYIAIGEIVRPLQTVGKSVHNCPNRGRTADVFLLDKMAEDKKVWSEQLRMHVRMARPKIDFPTADMCIDKHVLASYRTDLKYCWLLSDILTEHKDLYAGMEFDEWHQFAMMFKSEKAP